MATWEYKIVEPFYMNPKLTKNEDAEKYLNSLGQQGWELVSVMTVGDMRQIVDSVYYLKRQKS